MQNPNRHVYRAIDAVKGPSPINDLGDGVGPAGSETISDAHEDKDISEARADGASRDN